MEAVRQDVRFFSQRDDLRANPTGSGIIVRLREQIHSLPPKCAQDAKPGRLGASGDWRWESARGSGIAADQTNHR